MRINGTRALCDFVLTHAAEFNRVNMATAFHPILKNQRGIPPKSLAQALQTLEESALQNMQDFGARHIANTLHIVAKRYKPTGNLLLALERPAEAISVEFNSQAVCFKHSVGVCDDGDKAGEADDGAAGAAGGGDIRRVQLAECCSCAVGVCNDGDKAGGACDATA